MEDSVLNIKDTYNKAIEVCQYSPYSYSSATNPTVCGIEQIIGRTVADGVREKYISIQPQDEDEQINPMHKSMCGCRLTARVIFVMLLLGINEPSGTPFMEKYKSLFSTEHPNITNIIMDGLNVKQISEIHGGSVQNIYSYLPPQTSNLFIVQILKYIDFLQNYYPVHSFIVMIYPDNMCGVVSSWYSGDDSVATPIIYNKIPFEELQYVLKPNEGLLNNDYTDMLFGKGNNLEGNLETIFISKEAIIGEEGLGGGGGRRKRTKKKRKKRKKGKKTKRTKRTKRGKRSKKKLSRKKGKK